MSALIEQLVQILSDYGLVGMFIAAFLAGSVFPLSSELVLVALLGAGLNAYLLLVTATLGNTLGAMCNYGIGRLGKEEWIGKYLKIDATDLARGQRWVHRWGYWIGLLSWIPIVGELVTVALGYLRTNIGLTMLMVFVGKFIRYYLLIQLTLGTIRFLL